MISELKTSQSPSLKRSKLHLALLAAFFTSAAGLSSAQEASPTTTESDPPTEKSTEEALDDVVVVGIRGSIRSSITRKREETVIADVLSADDIGDLPALSIGEAIETITGAATHREKGGASEISIRGLGPFLGSASFNGREATNGSGDRSVNFNQFPSEVINTVSVFKSQRADFIEGGVAGTINLETVKPLDYNKQLLQLEGRGTYSGDQSKRTDSSWQDPDDIGWRGTASYIDQFAFGDGKLGVSLAVQSLETTNPEELISNSTTVVACDANRVLTTTQNCNATPALTAAQVAAGTPFYLLPGSRTYRSIIDDDKRDAVFGSVQWQPNESLDVALDVQWSERVYREDRSDLNFSETLRGLTNRVVDEDGILRGYSGNSSVESTNTFRIRDERYHGAGLAFDWRPSDAWTFSSDLSYSYTRRVEFDRQTRLLANATDINGVAVPGITGQRVNYNFFYPVGQDVPGIVVNPLFDLNDFDNFSSSARLRRDENLRKNTIGAARFDATFVPESGVWTALKSGIRLSELTYYDYDDRNERSITTAATIRAANQLCRRDFAQVDFLSGFSGNTITSWAQFDPRCLFNSFTGLSDIGLSTNSARLLSSREVEEQTKSIYFLGEFAHQMFDLPLTGNVGARFVRTDVSSIGRRGGLTVVTNADGTLRLTGNGQVESLELESDSSVFLPSLNAALELTHDKVLRLGLYRAMSRPDPSSLGAGRTFALATGVGFATLEDAIANITANGNPRIRPLLSWNADLSFEWYPDADSILSAAVYYKQFNGGFAPTVVEETFDINGVAVVVPVLQEDTTDEKSDLLGIELTGAHSFSYWPEPFDGLGLKVSYNYSDSNFKTEDLRLGEAFNPLTGVTTPRIVDPVGIFGLSDHVFSGSLFYEIGPVELQAIYKYRSEYYQKFVGAPAQNRIIRDTGVVDFRASYRYDANLSFSLEATNLNDEPRYSDIPIADSFREVSVYGPRYFLGVRYRF